MQKIALLALGDVYWTRFAKHLSGEVAKRNIELVIVAESRAGEYQSFLRRISYEGCTTYYFSDYLQISRGFDSENHPTRPLLCDYLRMSSLGQRKAVLQLNWENSGNRLGQFAAEILDIEKPDLILGDTVSTSIGWFFCEYATRKKIPYWGLTGSRLPGHFVISTTIDTEDIVVSSEYQNIMAGTAPMTTEELDWASEYIEGIDSVVPDYMKSPFLNSVALKKFLKARYIKIILGSILYTIKERNDLRGLAIRASPITSFLTAIRRNAMRLIKAPLVTRCYADTGSLDLESDFFLYPIHYQPEASTVVGSPFYYDQIEVIRNIAFSLPAGTKLYVKEHISNYGFPPLSFYRTLVKLPNVTLVDHRADIKKLIRKSRAVITLTSTAGYEALILNKRVYHFGNVFYTFHPNAIRVRSWQDLASQLADQSPLSDDVSTRAFVVAYRRYTHHGRLDFLRDDFGISDYILERAARLPGKIAASEPLEAIQ